MALNFKVTGQTTAVTPGRPSRAIRITLNGSGTLGSTASFALADGSTGTFYPASPVTIASGSGSGAYVEFVYTPDPSASGVITLTVTCTGGLAAVQTFKVPVASNASNPFADVFYEASAANLEAHNGWARLSPSNGEMVITAGSTLRTYADGTGPLAQYYGNTSAVPSGPDYDLLGIFRGADDATNTVDLMVGITTPTDGQIKGYRFGRGGTTWRLYSWTNNTTTSNLYTNASPSPTLDGTTDNPFGLSIRQIGGHQYLFFYAGTTLLGGSPILDDTWPATTAVGECGLLCEVSSGQTTTGTNGLFLTSYYLYNADWSSTALAPGVASPGSTGGTTAAATATAGSGGTGTISGQWLRSTASGTLGSAVSGQTTTTLADTGLTNSTTYYYTFRYTDSAGTPAVVYSNQITLVTTSGASPVDIDADDSHIFFSPGVWRKPADGTASLQTGGGTAIVKVSGTTQITLLLDSSINSSLASYDKPCFKVTVNAQPATYLQATSSNSLQLATGLTGTNVVRVECLGGQQGAGDGWTASTPIYTTKVTGFEIDSGGSFLTYTPPLTGRLVGLGDSYLESYGGGTGGSVAYYTYVDFTKSWLSYFALALGAEYSAVGAGGQGLTAAVSGSGFPAAPSSYDHYDSTHARVWGTLDFVVPCWGINDHGVSSSTISGLVQTMLAGIRSKVQVGTWIFWPTPAGGASGDLTSGGTSTLARDGIIAGVNAYKAANPGDTKVAYLDVGNEFFQSIDFAGSGGATTYALDRIHPSYADGYPRLGAKYARLAQAAMSATVPAATTYTLVFGSDAPVAGQRYKVTAKVPIGTSLAADVVVTLGGTNVQYAASQVASLSSSGTLTISSTTGEGTIYYAPTAAGTVAPSATNGGGLTNPTVAAVTASAAVASVDYLAAVGAIEPGETGYQTLRAIRSESLGRFSLTVAPGFAVYYRKDGTTEAFRAALPSSSGRGNPTMGGGL